MQTELLPGAERIFARDLAVVHAGQRAVGATPVAGLVLLVVLLVSAPRRFAGAARQDEPAGQHRSDRRGDPGGAGDDMDRSRPPGWPQRASNAARARAQRGSAELAKARILAQQARTDEMLQLIARGDITRGEEAFRGRLDELTGALGSAPATVVDTVQRWSAAHDRQVTAYVGGDYNAAVTQAVGADANGSAAQFAGVESGLRDHIEQTRAIVRDRTAAAGDALAWTPVGHDAVVGARRGGRCGRAVAAAQGVPVSARWMLVALAIVAGGCGSPPAPPAPVNATPAQVRPGRCVRGHRRA